MSKLQLKPEFENVPAGETLRGVASSSDSAAAAMPRAAARRVAAGAGAPMVCAAFVVDDGFRLFRVY